MKKPVVKNYNKNYKKKAATWLLVAYFAGAGVAGYKAGEVLRDKRYDELKDTYYHQSLNKEGFNANNALPATLSALGVFIAGAGAAITDDAIKLVKNTLGRNQSESEYEREM